MSCFNLQIKPQKSWRSLSSTFRSKLRKLKNSTSHVIATTRRLTSKSRRSSTRSSYREIDTKSFMSIYVDHLYAAAERDEKNRAREAAKPQSKASAGCSPNNHHHYHTGKLVMKCESSSSAAQVGGRRVDKIVEEKNVTYETIDDAWKAIVAKSPLLRVDERAEEFITKFRKDMILQKEKSLIDYHEMIARGT